MKLPWPLRLDIAYFVAQVISGVFDNDLQALIGSLEKLIDDAQTEIKKSNRPPGQLE